MTPRRQLLQAPPASDRESVRSSLDRAIAFGIDGLGFDVETEQALSSHDLMCRAGESSIDLALVAQIFGAHVRGGAAISDGDFRTSARMLRDRTAASTRLVARALNVHARDTGYSSDVWLNTAFDTTNLFLLDSFEAGETRVATMPPIFARVAARSLFEGLASSSSDRMAVPGYLADSLGAHLALFMHAQAVVIGDGSLDFQ